MFDFTAESRINENPCTKLVFQAKRTTKPLPDFFNTKFGVIQMVFDPPHVVVKEEYLIFDFVSMISAIGGTLGLCIGFSFTDFAGRILAYTEKTTKGFCKYQRFKDLQPNLRSLQDMQPIESHLESVAKSIKNSETLAARHIQLIEESYLIINEMKLLTSSCECQPDVKSTNSIADIQRENDARVTSSSKMALEELESANCSGSTLIHEVIDKSQKNVA